MANPPDTEPDKGEEAAQSPAPPGPGDLRPQMLEDLFAAWMACQSVKAEGNPDTALPADALDLIIRWLPSLLAIAQDHLSGPGSARSLHRASTNLHSL